MSRLAAFCLSLALSAPAFAVPTSEPVDPPAPSSSFGYLWGQRIPDYTTPACVAGDVAGTGASAYADIAVTNAMNHAMARWRLADGGWSGWTAVSGASIRCEASGGSASPGCLHAGSLIEVRGCEYANCFGDTHVASSHCEAGRGHYPAFAAGVESANPALAGCIDAGDLAAGNFRARLTYSVLPALSPPSGVALDGRPPASYPRLRLPGAQSGAPMAACAAGRPGGCPAARLDAEGRHVRWFYISTAGIAPLAGGETARTLNLRAKLAAAKDFEINASIELKARCVAAPAVYDAQAGRLADGAEEELEAALGIESANTGVTRENARLFAGGAEAALLGADAGRVAYTGPDTPGTVAFDERYTGRDGRARQSAQVSIRFACPPRTRYDKTARRCSAAACSPSKVAKNCPEGQDAAVWDPDACGWTYSGNAPKCPEAKAGRNPVWDAAACAWDYAAGSHTARPDCPAEGQGKSWDAAACRWADAAVERNCPSEGQPVQWKPNLCAYSALGVAKAAKPACAEGEAEAIWNPSACRYEQAPAARPRAAKSCAAEGVVVTTPKAWDAASCSWIDGQPAATTLAKPAPVKTCAAEGIVTTTPQAWDASNCAWTATGTPADTLIEKPAGEAGDCSAEGKKTALAYEWNSASCAWDPKPATRTVAKPAPDPADCSVEGRKTRTIQVWDSANCAWSAKSATETVAANCGTGQAAVWEAGSCSYRCEGCPTGQRLADGSCEACPEYKACSGGSLVTRQWCHAGSPPDNAAMQSYEACENNATLTKQACVAPGGSAPDDAPCTGCPTGQRLVNRSCEACPEYKACENGSLATLKHCGAGNAPANAFTGSYTRCNANTGATETVWACFAYGANVPSGRACPPRPPCSGAAWNPSRGNWDCPRKNKGTETYCAAGRERTRPASGAADVDSRRATETYCSGSIQRTRTIYNTCKNRDATSATETYCDGGAAKTRTIAGCADKDSRPRGGCATTPTCPAGQVLKNGVCVPKGCADPGARQPGACESRSYDPATCKYAFADTSSGPRSCSSGYRLETNGCARSCVKDPVACPGAPAATACGTYSASGKDANGCAAYSYQANACPSKPSGNACKAVSQSGTDACGCATWTVTDNTPSPPGHACGDVFNAAACSWSAKPAPAAPGHACGDVFDAASCSWSAKPAPAAPGHACGDMFDAASCSWSAKPAPKAPGNACGDAFNAATCSWSAKPAPKAPPGGDCERVNFNATLCAWSVASTLTGPASCSSGYRLETNGCARSCVREGPSRNCDPGPAPSPGACQAVALSADGCEWVVSDNPALCKPAGRMRQDGEQPARGRHALRGIFELQLEMERQFGALAGLLLGICVLQSAEMKALPATGSLGGEPVP